VSFHGGFGLLNVWGVRKPVFRAFELLRTGGSTRAKLSLSGAGNTLYAVALLDGETLQASSKLTVLIANHAANDKGVAGRNTKKPLAVSVSLKLSNFAHASATMEVSRINASSANAKEAWERQGAPQWPSPKQIEGMHTASAMVNDTVEIDAAVVVEAYSVVALTIKLK